MPFPVSQLVIYMIVGTVFYGVLTMAARRRWRDLAEVHPETADPTGDSFPMSHLAVRPGLGYSYDKLFVHVGEGGLSFRAFPLLRWLMPSIFVPWTAVQRCIRKRNFLGSWVEIELENPPYTLVIGRGLGRAVHHQCDLRGLCDPESASVVPRPV